MSKLEDFYIDIPHNKITQKIQDRYFANIELEKHLVNNLDITGHINGQERYPVGKMHFGWTFAGNTACEVIAIYNVLCDLNRIVPLSKLIFYDEVLGYLFAFGYFGTKISKIGKFLNKLDIPYKKTHVKKFINNAYNNKYDEGQMFIVSILNRKGIPVSSIHTFEVKHKFGKWIVYNRYNGDSKPRIYDNVNDILKNGPITGKFISIYKIDSLEGAYAE